MLFFLLLSLTMRLFGVSKRKKSEEEKNLKPHMFAWLFMKLPNPHVYVNKNVRFWCCGFTVSGLCGLDVHQLFSVKYGQKSKLLCQRKWGKRGVFFTENCYNSCTETVKYHWNKYKIQIKLYFIIKIKRGVREQSRNIRRNIWKTSINSSLTINVKLFLKWLKACDWKIRMQRRNRV